MLTSQVTFDASQTRTQRLDSPDAIAALEARRERLVPAIVLTWTAYSVYVRCPFASCQIVHHHGYTEPREGRLNSRWSHCPPPRQQEYRLLFPFEDDPAVRGFDVEVDRDECLWRTVGVGLKDPRVEEEDINSLYDQMAKARISTDEYLISVEEGDNEGQCFISECVNNELAVCRQMLQNSPDRTRLVRGRNLSNDTALSLACMEGHMDIVKLLCEYDPDLGNVNNEGNTPLMEALSYGRGAVAMHLIRVNGPSIAARNDKGMSVLDIAKASLKFMNDMEQYRPPTGFRERKTNNEHFTNVINHCDAQLKNKLLAIKKHSSNPSCKQSITIHQREVRGATEVSVHLNKFTTPMAGEKKTFAYLDRGEPFEDVMAVSGWTPGEFGDSDGCLDREEWTAKVCMFSRAIGHVLSEPNDYYACHAEKQLMAYFLWKHTTLQDKVKHDTAEEKKRNRDLYELKFSKPARLRLKKDIYVTKEPCFDCKAFQKRVKKVASIDFNIIHVPPERPIEKRG